VSRCVRGLGLRELRVFLGDGAEAFKAEDHEMDDATEDRVDICVGSVYVVLRYVDGRKDSLRRGRHHSCWSRDLTDK
jgi:hypothetical protein